MGPAGLMEKRTPLIEKLTYSLEPLLFLLHNKGRGPQAQEVATVSGKGFVRSQSARGARDARS